MADVQMDGQTGRGRDRGSGSDKEMHATDRWTSRKCLPQIPLAIPPAAAAKANRAMGDKMKRGSACAR